MEKFKRKHFFINKRLQTRYMISMLIPMLILVVFIGLVMFKSQSMFLRATLSEISKDVNLITANNMSMNPNYLDTCTARSKTVADIKSRMTEYQSDNASFSEGLFKSTYTILGIGLVVVIVELGFLTIFISHKVVGPIYRLSKFAEEIRGGNFNAQIYLRKGDELVDVAMDFNKTSDFLKETFGRTLAVNNELFELAKSGKPDAARVSMLQREIDELKSKIKLG